MNKLDKELIHEIATDVMDWHLWEADKWVENRTRGKMVAYNYDKCPNNPLSFNPLAYWRDTGRVIERMKEIGYQLYIDSTTVGFLPDGCYEKVSVKGADGSGYPLEKRICRSALATVSASRTGEPHDDPER